VSTEEALAEEVRARRHALRLRLVELSDLAAHAAVQIYTWTEPKGWERILEHKMTAVHEAALLLNASQR